MIELGRIYNEDCIETMKRMEDESLDLVLTSPPYDGLRMYGGFNFDFYETAKEISRVVKIGGIVVWVVADQTVEFRESLTSFKQALYFSGQGLGLLDTMIYHKPSIPPPYPSMRRYAQSFEYMFVFSKGKPSTFNPVMIEKINASTTKATFRQKDGTLKKQNRVSASTTKPITNVWSISSGGVDIGHPAVFPETLAVDHIYTWSNTGELTYDPFMGSGTTAVACEKLGRKWIGSEINPDYCKIAEKRIANERAQTKLEFT